MYGTEERLVHGLSSSIFVPSSRGAIMNKRLSGLLFAVFIPMAAQTQTSDTYVFLESLNRCLETPRTSLVECARLAGSTANSGWVSVTQNFAASANSGVPGTGVDTVNDCHMAPHGEVCDVYECEEDVQSGQSSCTLAYLCVDEPEYGAMCVEAP